LNVAAILTHLLSLKYVVGIDYPDVTNPEQELISYLFKKYDQNARPAIGVTSAVNLTFDLALRQMLDMDEKQQIMTTSVWIRHYWTDPYLVWYPANWSDISFLAVSPDIIWKPDITLYNNAEREFQGFDNFGKTRVNVYNNGYIVWLVPVILRSECKLYMDYFPFDTQTCQLTFGSWAYDGGAMDFHQRNSIGDLSNFSPSGEFFIEGLEATRISKLYACCPNPYVTITYTIRLHRRVKFYFFNLIIPGILIAFLSCFSFFLPPLSGERTGLIITNFLSLSVYVLMVSDSVPPSSESVPLLVRFYTIMVCEIALALIINCIVIPLAVKDVPLPGIIRTLVLEKLARIVLCSYDKPKSNEIRPQKVNNRDNNRNEDIFISSTNLLNGSFVFLNDFEKEDNRFSIGNHPGAPNIQNNKLLKQQSVRNINTKTDTYYEKASLHYLRSISNYLKDEKKSQQNTQDWETVINVLDRIFFALFSLIIIISSIVLVLEAPDINL